MDVDAMRDNWLMSGVDADARAHLLKNHDKYLHKALVAEGYAK